jgi:hypothetical protein
MATLYFIGVLDGDWATLGNWWTSDAFTTQASALPTSSDSVVLLASVGSNSGSAPTVANLTSTASIDITITVNGNATFNNGGFNYGTVNVNGNATFNNSGTNGGTVNGDATFNGESNGGSFNNGTVDGNATFNDGSLNNGTVSGDATFNGGLWNVGSFNSGTVSGNATFNGESTMTGGSVSGNATFSGTAKQTGGNVTGNATFNGSSCMEGGVVEGNATFNDTSLLGGNGYPATYGTVVLNDYATANGAWNTSGGPTAFNDHANLSNIYPTSGACEFNDHATCNGFGMRSNATFNDFSVCAGVVDGGYSAFTFNDSATGGFDVQPGGWWSPPEPDVTYNDNSYGSGKAMTLTINGAAVMQNAYLNGYNPVLDYSFTRPQYGINGSSILGVI